LGHNVALELHCHVFAQSVPRLTLSSPIVVRYIANHFFPQN
jgi:hypothetical protein